ncbi:MAG: C2H2-type zinc finger protein, partial [bacterium]
MHTKARDFKCSQCTKTYVTASCLNYHMKSHSGAKLHVCHHCTKSFREASSLR